MLARRVDPGNGDDGIAALPNSVISGSTTQQNANDGVRCLPCVLPDNLISDHQGFGASFGGKSVYGRNLIDGIVMGEVLGSALAVDANRCGAVACP